MTARFFLTPNIRKPGPEIRGYTEFCPGIKGYAEFKTESEG